LILTTHFLNQGNKMGIYLIYHKIYECIRVIKRGFITMDELGKMVHLFFNNIDYEIPVYGIKRFKKSLNIIKQINNYNVENKYDLTEHTLSMLKCSNQNILDKMIIITPINQSLKDSVIPLMNFLMTSY